MNSINVCLACDDNYAKYAGVVIASVLTNASSDDHLTFYILDGNVSSANKENILALKSIKDCTINFVQVDNSLFKDYMEVRTHSYLSIPAYYRLKIPSLLPNVDKVIYFDCDVVVNTSLANLFNTEMENCIIAGVNDLNKRMLRRNSFYVNAGMLLINITKMREENIEEKLLNWTRENIETIKIGDQEILNEVLKDRIKLVDDKWNVQSSNFTNRSSYTNHPNVVHFVASRKPWHWGSFSYHRNLYFKYLQLTPWKLSSEDLKLWTKKNQIASLVSYIKHRPIFFLRPRFYQALYYTYIKRSF